MNLPEKVKTKLRDIPDKPGCYMMRDRRGRIIYVGKAVSLRKRVQSYFRQASFRKGDPKLRGLVKSTWDLDYIVVGNEAEALLTEGRLIKEYKPRYNVSFKDDKRFLLLRAEPDQMFPMFKLCRIRRDDGALYFGPYVSSTAARATLDFIERKLGLRKCAPVIPDKNTYKHCMNDIVRYCSAPCVEKVTPEEYRARFDDACSFLSGRRPVYLADLKKTMEEAGAELKFEKAAALRDTYFMLKKTIEQNARVTKTPEMKRNDAVAGLRELKMLLGTKGLPRVIEAYDISNISGTYAVAGLVCFVDGLPRRNRYRRFRIKTIEGSNDPGMIAEVIHRRFKRGLGDKSDLPGLVLVDGGIAQMLAAEREMKMLGIDNISVAGLAKKFEEIYTPDRKVPLRLKKSSPALQILQRLRDEAHRFALAYHHKLRSKRIRESVLDDVPGIGVKRKKLLLSHFGSVNRLTKATEEQIAKVPGIGYEMARMLKRAL